MEFFSTVLAPQDHQRREQSVNGLSIARITGRMDDGTYELKYLGMGGNAPSAPARMMMPNAGKDRGFHWMPEVGDEVVVGFESSDTNAPIILGALYNNRSTTPKQAKPSNENHVRTMVSRTGHEITLDDSPAAGKVMVKTADGRKLTLDDTPPGRVSLETPNGIAIELDDANGTLTLKAPTAIVLETSSLMLKVGGMSVLPGDSIGTGSVNIKVPAAVSLDAAVISLRALAINLMTSGTMPTSTVVIDGKPFGLHLHGPPLPAPATTPPVQP